MAASLDLGCRRTFLAHDRTLMAWIRTSVSLIGFGFTIHKFFDYLREADNLPPSHSLVGPRQFAISMIGVGVVALAAATIQYRHSVQTLEKEMGQTYRSFTGTLAAVVAVAGALVLVVTFLRL